MARIRTVKPEFWTSEQIAECSPIARLLFIGLWNFCDDGGNHSASPRRLIAEVFPMDKLTLDDILSLIAELISARLLIEYIGGDGLKYWHVTGWHHQKIDRPTFKHPPFIDESSSNTRRDVDEASPPEGKGREGKGKEGRSPSVDSGGDGFKKKYIKKDFSTVEAERDAHASDAITDEARQANQQIDAEVSAKRLGDILSRVSNARQKHAERQQAKK
jgi:hypothetical protein